MKITIEIPDRDHAIEFVESVRDLDGVIVGFGGDSVQHDDLVVRPATIDHIEAV